MARKNRNGMGTIRQRPDGRYEARYTGVDGRQHSIYGSTPSEVSKALRAATASVDSGDWLQPSRITVSEWLDVWLRDYCAHIRPGTRRIYEARCAHIRRSIGNIRLSVLSPAHVRRVLADAQREGLASSTTAGIRNLLSVALTRAVEARLIRENPAASVKPPKVVPVREMHIIDRPQIPAFFAAAQNTPYGSAIIFLLLTGLRVGELLGLTWSCVDFAASQITVSRQLVRTGGAHALAPTKTGETRKLLLLPDAVALLRAQRVRQTEQRVAAGHMWTSGAPHDDLVFRQANGRCIDSKTIALHTRHVGQLIGIPGLHPHDLRHSYAVAALRAGMDVKTVQHNLGHASAAMTLDVYAKYTEDAGAAAARLLSAYFSGSGSF